MASPSCKRKSSAWALSEKARTFHHWLSSVVSQFKFLLMDPKLPFTKTLADGRVGLGSGNSLKPPAKDFLNFYDVEPRGF